MLADLAAAFPLVEETYREASDALGYDLWRVCREGAEANLNATECTQPAMLAAGIAVWRVWREQGGREPDAMAGHSLGEYSALVCARSVRFADAVALVASRGRFMQEAVPMGQGAVAAVIGLADDDVDAACRAAEQGEVVRPVNFNARGRWSSPATPRRWRGQSIWRVSRGPDGRSSCRSASRSIPRSWSRPPSDSDRASRRSSSRPRRFR